MRVDALMSRRVGVGAIEFVANEPRVRNRVVHEEIALLHHLQHASAQAVQLLLVAQTGRLQRLSRRSRSRLRLAVVRFYR